MLPPELAAEVRTFEEAAANVSSSGLFTAWEKLHKSFLDAKLSATDHLRPETLRTVSLLSAEFGRQKPVLAALAASRWKLTAEAFVDTFSPKALMSCEFVSQVRKLADDTTVTFAEAVEAMKRERTRRLTTSGKPGLPKTPDWTPLDAGNARKGYCPDVVLRRPQKRRKTSNQSGAANVSQQEGADDQVHMSSPPRTPAVIPASPRSPPRTAQSPPSNHALSMTDIEQPRRGTDVLGDDDFGGYAMTAEGLVSDDESDRFDETPAPLRTKPTTGEKASQSLDTADPFLSCEKDSLETSKAPVPVEVPTIRHLPEQRDSGTQRFDRHISEPPDGDTSAYFPSKNFPRFERLGSNSKARMFGSAGPGSKEPPKSPSAEANVVAFGADEDTRVANALRALEGDNWLGEETITSVLALFIPNTGVRIVDIGTVPPDGAWERWASAKDSRVRLRKPDEMVIVPLFDPQRMHWQLLAFELTRKDVVITAYDSMVLRTDTTELAARSIAKFLGFSPERSLRFRRDPGALQQTNSHDCGIFVIVHALFTIARSSIPTSADGSLWRMFFRCCLQKERLQQEVDAALASMEHVQERLGPQLLKDHATAIARCKRLKHAVSQADEFFKVVLMVKHRASEGSQKIQDALSSVTHRQNIIRDLDRMLGPDLDDAETQARDLLQTGLESVSRRCKDMQQSGFGATSNAGGNIASFVNVASQIHFKFQLAYTEAKDFLEEMDEKVGVATREAEALLQYSKVLNG
ncbi:uncharacterized protein LTHEOB_11344 [Lasiodiplodia theobromae]|uniref:uncharacterized protein n=1 Tax=Lasiodiplodia theobromae TaxID=45133 RepID=UPI0015C2C63F|nr:uncharacterized protein LTHEOB_11344 [Lasiodiplodia theobromae]KAF4537860.1 hypothetical protein LTHEOB_11344 [Lasiodiplodia theobromae]